MVGHFGPLLATFGHLWPRKRDRHPAYLPTSRQSLAISGHFWTHWVIFGQFWSQLVTFGHPLEIGFMRFLDSVHVRYGEHLLQRALHQCPPSSTKLPQAPPILRWPAKQISMEKGHKIHQGPPGFTQIPQAPPRRTSAYFPKNRLLTTLGNGANFSPEPGELTMKLGSLVRGLAQGGSVAGGSPIVWPRSGEMSGSLGTLYGEFTETRTCAGIG